MKRINKILLTAALLMLTVAANAQYWGYRPWFPPSRYQDRINKEGEYRNNQNFQNNQPTKLHLNLDYAITQPFGSMNNYAGKTSFNGWRISLLYAINDKWQVGLGSGFNDYYKRIPRAVYQEKGSTISAVQTRTLQLIPIQPTALYFPEVNSNAIRPYVGLGIGVTDVNYQKYWGEFAEKYNNIAFSASPMIGLRIPFGKTSPLQFNADARYNFISYSRSEISGIHTVGVNVGLSLNIR